MKEEGRKHGPFEGGDWRLGGAGTRTDLLSVCDRVKEGATETDISSEFPVAYIKYRRGIQGLISLSEKTREQPPEIILCYGPTGTGKTKHCYDTWPKLYRKPCDTRWFDRYQGQATLLLDDFGGAMSKMSLLYLLQLLDRYPLLVEAKGTYCNLMATTIVITTNHHPRKWYDYEKREESYAALERRVHQVLYFENFGEDPEECEKSVFFQNYYEGVPTSQFIQHKIEESDSTMETDEQSSSEESSDEELEVIGGSNPSPEGRANREERLTKRKRICLEGRDITDKNVKFHVHFDEHVAKKAKQ